MATIEQNIARITQAKADIKAAIEAKGVTVDSAATIDAYADYVDDIPTGGGGENRLNMLLTNTLTSVTAADLSGVTNIGVGKFNGCTHLKSFDFSNITGISESSFAQTGLEDIKLTGVTSLGQRAFEACGSLTAVTLSDNLTSIPMYLFNASPICNLTIPSGVTFIGMYSSYANAYHFEGATPPNNVQNNALWDKATICVPSGAVDTYKSAWSAKSDYIVAYPATGLSEIHYTSTDGNIVNPSTWRFGGWFLSNTYDETNKGVMAFSGILSRASSFRDAQNLQTIEFPEGITTSENYLFYGCYNITEVVFPSTYTAVTTFNFNDLSQRQLASVTFKGTTPPSLGNNNTFNSTTTIYVPAEAVETYKAASGWSRYASQIQAIPTP